MKRNVFFGGLASFVCLACLVSCNDNSVIISDPLPSSDDSDAVVHVQTRASQFGSLSYPLNFYAFDTDGQLQDEFSVGSDDAACSLHLPEGVLSHIVVVSASDDYVLPQQISHSSVIEMKQSGMASGSPLQMGFADITPSSGNVSVQIQLSYQVASLEFCFSGMPESCSAVNVSVSSVSNGVSLSGEYSGEGSVTVNCSRQGEDWVSGPVYLFPSLSDRTVFTVSYSDENGAHACSVNYVSQLSAGVPYMLNGSFTDGYLDISGSVSFSEWGDTKVIDFNFGPNADTEISGDGPVHEEDVFEVDVMPASCSVWNGHIVALVDNSSSESAVITLLSLRNWGNMTSSLNVKTPDMASDAAYAYVENGMAGWEIPSEADAKEIKKLYNESTLASTIQEAAADTIVLKNEKGENARYLSEKATRAYGFSPDSNVGKAGASNTDYYLRLVRKVNIVLRK